MNNVKFAPVSSTSQQEVNNKKPQKKTNPTDQKIVQINENKQGQQTATTPQKMEKPVTNLTTQTKSSVQNVTTNVHEGTEEHPGEEKKVIPVQKNDTKQIETVENEPSVTKEQVNDEKKETLIEKQEPVKEEENEPINNEEPPELERVPTITDKEEVPDQTEEHVEQKLSPADKIIFDLEANAQKLYVKIDELVTRTNDIRNKVLMKTKTIAACTDPSTAEDEYKECLKNMRTAYKQWKYEDATQKSDATRTSEMLLELNSKYEQMKRVQLQLNFKDLIKEMPYEDLIIMQNANERFVARRERLQKLYSDIQPVMDRLNHLFEKCVRGELLTMKNTLEQNGMLFSLYTRMTSSDILTSN